MAIEVQPEGRFGNYLHAALERNNIEIKHLARDMESTYEHIRKLIKGLAFPSQYMLDNLAKNVKGFDKKEALLLVEQDKAQRKMKNFHVITGKNPELDPFDQKWKLLSDTSKKTLYNMLDMLCDQDKAATRVAKK